MDGKLVYINLLKFASIFFTSIIKVYTAPSLTVRHLSAGRSVAKPLLALSIDTCLLEDEEIGATGDCQANGVLVQRN